MVTGRREEKTVLAAARARPGCGHLTTGHMSELEGPRTSITSGSGLDGASFKSAGSGASPMGMRAHGRADGTPPMERKSRWGSLRRNSLRNAPPAEEPPEDKDKEAAPPPPRAGKTGGCTGDRGQKEEDWSP